MSKCWLQFDDRSWPDDVDGREGTTPKQRHRLYDGAEFAPAALTTTENALAIGSRGGTVIHRYMPENVRLESADFTTISITRRFGWF